ncbi:MAG: hypothetical protein ACREYE_31765 [Gammaproteobacteria bacterium]
MTEDHSLLYRFNLEYLDRNTFQDFVSENRIFLTPSVTWRPSDDTELNFTFEYRNQEQVSSGSFPALDNRPAAVPISRSFTGPGLNGGYDIYAFYLKGSHKFNEHLTLRMGGSAWIGDYKYGFFGFNTVDHVNRQVLRGVLFSDFDERSNYDAYLDLLGASTPSVLSIRYYT